MRVLLTRPQAQSEELGTVLKARGIEWLGEPLLRIMPVSWDPAVLAGPQAVLLTSANASRELLKIPGARRDMPVFAVGPATAEPLEAAGFSNVQAAGGTAVNLMAHVRQKVDPRAGRLLHLSGRDISLDLAAGLAPAGFDVDRLIVYRASPVERLSARTLHEMSWNRIDGAVFLSARTAAVFCSLVIASGLVEACARMTAFAISLQAAEALKPAGFRQVVVAAAPSLDSIVKAILRRTTEDA
ncbi:uroporphyrinogen-III synthase [Microvirga sp. Mcv34]|uniref:uroporphyrinogen-III synthase n=1 Tax=Microvirga sp. Mcv34 TaxID=2926016 RepID=UPI0021C86FC5|nr:uroporphyrinogen-III synthase [Microvirga sp. Mcv34]